ncbi:MAG: VCBS repeat-containing protein [Planctomycetota bacterium]
MTMILTLMLLTSAPAPAAIPQTTPGGPPQVSWSRRRLFTESGAPSLPDAPFLAGGGVAAGDIDRDGDEDLVIATQTGPVVWENRGVQGFVATTPTRIPVSPGPSAKVYLADLTGDGWLDLVTSGTSSSQVDYLVPNDRTGRFVGPIALPQAQTVTSHIALADMEGDGDIDLVRAIGANGHFNATGLDSLLVNDGAGNFTEDASFQLSPWNDVSMATTSVEVFDANGDGILDILVCRADSGTFTGSFGAQNSLLYGAGNRRFFAAPASALPAVDDNSYGAAARDYDGDGDLDVVVSNVVSGVGFMNSADVLLNQGGVQGGTEGVFEEFRDAIQEMESPAESLRLGLTVGDVNLDGRADVLFFVHDLPPGGDQTLYLARSADATFVRDTTFRTGTFIAGGGVMFDADGDGDLDIFITAAGSAAGGTDPFRPRLYRNTVR